ncbi:MAG: methylated-DNA--[protein]-cysteine S-methyltransferase [Peptococcales bacterium]|jgi:O-6-methylguanine DNA methyltransferase
MDKELHYTYFDSPLGKLGLVASSKGLVLMDFLDWEEKDFRRKLHKKFPTGVLMEGGCFIEKPLEEIKEYFLGKRQDFTCLLDLEGTPFQIKVWQALQEIPYGETYSYEDVARKIGNIKAVRAVGSANGKNPISIIIPCHRVIRKSGELGGYSSGLERKKFLLELERKAKNVNR